MQCYPRNSFRSNLHYFQKYTDWRNKEREKEDKKTTHTPWNLNPRPRHECVRVLCSIDCATGHYDENCYQ